MAFGKLLISNTIYRIFNISTLFIITILLSRIVDVSGFGVISLMITNATVFNLFTSFGLESASTYFTIKRIFSPQKILSLLLTLIFFQLLFFSSIEMILFFCTKSFTLMNSKSTIDLFLGISFCLSLSIIDKFSALLHGEQKFELAIKIVFLSNLLLLLTLLILYAIRIKDFRVCLTVYIILYFIQAIAIIFSYFKITKQSFQFTFLRKDEIRLFFSFSFLVYLINTIQFIAYRIDFWFINYYKGDEELGWYSLSVRLTQMFWIIPNFLSVIIFPKIALSNNTTQPNLHQIIRTSNTFNLIVGIILFFTSSWLIPVIFGNSFKASVLSFQILLPGVIIFSISTILASYYAGMNKLIVNLSGSLICMSTILLLDAILIPKFGLVGAATASSIGYVLTTIYFIWIYLFDRNIHFREMILLNKDDLVTFRGLFIKILKK